MKSILGIAAAGLVLSFASIAVEPMRDLGGTPPGQGKKNRLPKPVRETTQPDGESRQVRRARERAAAKRIKAANRRDEIRERGL